MKKYNLTDLYYNILRSKKNETGSYLSGKVLAIRIISLYFRKILEMVLSGYEYDFDMILKNRKVNFGSISVVKRRLGKRRPFISRIETVRNRKVTLSYNPRTVGFYYEIVYDWDLLKEYDMKFKASGNFTGKLFKNLYFKGKDYLLKE